MLHVRPWRIVRAVPAPRVAIPRPVIVGSAVLLAGDSREVLKTLADNSVDSIVTDPPYALVSVVKRFGKPGSAPAKGNQAFVRSSRGFMGKSWDNGDAAHDVRFWGECYRVLKPGGFVLAFGGTRTYHRLACAIEDAGFEIRDMVQWLYGSGFAKSHSVSKGIDAKELLGSSRTEDIRKLAMGDKYEASGRGRVNYDNGGGSQMNGIADGDPITDVARQWKGWGTALKPANEPICMARKSLSEGTVAANVLRWSTGAINIDACRIPPVAGDRESYGVSGDEGKPSANAVCYGERNRVAYERPVEGRFPANVITDGSDEVVAMLPANAGGQDKRVGLTPGKRPSGFGNVGNDSGDSTPNGRLYGDSGSAARFWYQAKATKKDRANSRHPTVKPVALMRYLCRLVTPPFGTILDPFAGSGTMGEAAHLEGFKSIMIEREAEYLADIRNRMSALNVELTDGTAVA